MAQSCSDALHDIFSLNIGLLILDVLTQTRTLHLLILFDEIAHSCRNILQNVDTWFINGLRLSILVKLHFHVLTPCRLGKHTINFSNSLVGIVAFRGDIVRFWWFQFNWFLSVILFVFYVSRIERNRQVLYLIVIVGHTIVVHTIAWI